MQPEQRDVSYLWDMLEAARRVLEFTHGVSLAEYSKNLMLHLAVERAIQIIGEAANGSAPPFSKRIPRFPGVGSWRNATCW